jgi:hypothetical protein
VVEFASVSKDVLKGVRDMLDDLGIGGTKETKERRRQGAIGGALGGLAGGIGVGAIGAGIGQVLIPIPGVGAAIGAGVGGLLGGYLGEKVGSAGSKWEYDLSHQKPGAADGGVLSGPKSGYPATLHGTEAVVPLPDGKNIPVNMDTSALTAAMHHQSGILNEILRAMRDNNSLTSGILQHTM